MHTMVELRMNSPVLMFIDATLMSPAASSPTLQVSSILGSKHVLRQFLALLSS